MILFFIIFILYLKKYNIFDENIVEGITLTTPYYKY